MLPHLNEFVPLLPVSQGAAIKLACTPVGSIKDTFADDAAPDPDRDRVHREAGLIATGHFLVVTANGGMFGLPLRGYLTDAQLPVVAAATVLGDIPACIGVNPGQPETPGYLAAVQFLVGKHHRARQLPFNLAGSVLAAMCGSQLYPVCGPTVLMARPDPDSQVRRKLTGRQKTVLNSLLLNVLSVLAGRTVPPQEGGSPELVRYVQEVAREVSSYHRELPMGSASTVDDTPDTSPDAADLGPGQA